VNVNEGRDWDNLGGARKAAIVLLALGKEASAQIVKNLKDSEMEKIAAEMASLGRIPPEVEQRVLVEFTGAMGSGTASKAGGVGRAAEFLESIMGRQKASEIVTKMKRLNATGALGRLEQMEPGMAAEFLSDEHPQTIALILAQVETDFAASTLSALPPDVRTDVAMRIARLNGISPDTTKEIEGILSTELQDMQGGDIATANGVKILADILNSTERDTEKEVLEGLEAKDEAMASEVRKLMFVFDDILLLEDRSVQRVLREVDTKDLAVALKAADEEVKAKIFKNISERAAAMIQEEIDYMGPKRLSEVEAAQMSVVEVIRNLEESGEIIVPGRGGGGDDLIV
jgi:flagellar motor switch protein FliG